MNRNLTLGSLLLEKVHSSPEKNAIGHIVNNKIEFFTFKEYFKHIEIVAYGLQHHGLEIKAKLAIASHTRYEWNIIDHAVISLRATLIPIYPTYLANEVKFIINHSECSVLILENQEQFDKFLLIQHELPNVKTVISIDNLSSSCMDKISSKMKLVNWSDLLLDGEKIRNNNPGRLEQIINEQQGCDIASIVYTSGTTGEPKGAVITHHAFASMLLNVKSTVEGAFTNRDRSLVFLPLSHVFGRCDSWLNIAVGVESVYAEAIDKVVANLKLVRPTILLAVPRIFEKIYEKVLSSIESSSFIKKQLFRWAIKSSNNYFQALNHNQALSLMTKIKKDFAYHLVLKKIYNRFGGKIRYFVSGGAPIEKEIVDFMRCAGLTILEGYGLTETIAPCILNPINKQLSGSIGKPLNNVFIKFADDGEIMIKTEALFSEYYKNPEATTASLQDGWFLTGDIGTINEEGYIIITDRKKDLIITSGGKNVAPQFIENKMKLQEHIAHCMVIGDKRQYLTAVIGIERHTFLSKLHEIGLSSTATIEEIANNPNVKEIIAKEINKVNEGLARFETIKKFYVAPLEFSIENGFLTPSLKLKKKNILKSFESEINAMY